MFQRIRRLFAKAENRSLHQIIMDGDYDPSIHGRIPEEMLEQHTVDGTYRPPGYRPLLPPEECAPNA